MSSGAGGMLREAMSWVLVAGAFTVVAMNFDQIRAFNAELLGITLPQNGEGDKVMAATEAPRQQASASGFSVELRSDRRGHFEAEAEVNGRDISALVDTGATMVVLTYEDAERAGLDVRPSDFTATSRTANGMARNAPVTLDKLCIESVCVRDIRAMVAEEGRLHVSLLGMSFLGRLSRFEVRSGTLLLEE